MCAEQQFGRAKPLSIVNSQLSIMFQVDSLRFILKVSKKLTPKKIIEN